MYSQFDEEKYILEALKEITTGTFLDLGAWHATEFSNTRALFERGWRGILVEPSPGPMLGLLKEYGDEERITLIQACVVIEGSLVRLHVTDDATSTTEEGNFEQWKETSRFHGSMLCPGITLEQFSNQFGGFDMVNIDVEGTSVNLFHRMLELGWRPRCVVVEHDERTTELLAAATAAGYHCTLANGTNVVLVQ